MQLLIDLESPGYAINSTCVDCGVCIQSSPGVALQ
jgi:NAD-dependent dihydropyrimidine dehydrogenase PreA subunit